MKRVIRLLLVIVAVALAARSTAACATDDDAPGEGSPDAAFEANLLDAGPPDVVLDAAVEADAQAPTCSADGWCVVGLPEAGAYDASALPPTVPGTVFALRAVWASPDGNAWAVSAAGHVMQFDGTRWNVVAIAPQPLRTVWGRGTTDVWVGGERGLVWHGTITGGAVTFAPVTLATTQTIAKITGTSATDVWAIADGLEGSGTMNRVWRLAASGDAFVPTTVPSPYTDSTGKLRLTALWSTGSDVWAAGYATTCGGPGPCKFSDQLLALAWNGADAGASDAGADAAAAWTYVPLLRNYSDLVTAGAGTADGVQLLSFRGPGSDEAHVARVAADATKLDGGPGPDSGISVEGAYAWTQELATEFGSPTGVWATSQNDAFLVGKAGVVRHYDGKGWQLVRLSLTSLTPILSDLYAIDGITAPSGARHLWIVGDDVALKKTVQP